MLRIHKLRFKQVHTYLSQSLYSKNVSNLNIPKCLAYLYYRFHIMEYLQYRFYTIEFHAVSKKYDIDLNMNMDSRLTD